jgi:hypothetical protein
MRKPNLNNFGDKLKFKPRAKKRETITEKDLFIETMALFNGVWARSNEAYDKYKINLLEYEELFYQVIEGFILLKYDFWKTEIILWYIFARFDENGNVYPLKYKLQDEVEREAILDTPSDLWDLLQIIENDLK